MKLAAVDIGSNAIRMKIANVIRYNGQDTIKTLEYLRFPLRLGKDVFSNHRISPELESKFLRLIGAFRTLIDLYEVTDFRICATSAMREAENGRELADALLKNLGIHVEIIDGEEEADLISGAIRTFIDHNTFLHIDVGGGSTELNLYVDAQKISSASFQIGSVRNLDHYDFPETWVKLEDWIKSNVKKLYQPVTAIGTGGNISKLFELSRNKNKKARSITLADLLLVQFEVAGLSMQERINHLMLNPDRADVIVPASEIYVHVMQKAKAKKMIVPDLGLIDGIIRQLYEKHKDKVL